MKLISILGALLCAANVALAQPQTVPRPGGGGSGTATNLTANVLTNIGLTYLGTGNSAFVLSNSANTNLAFGAPGKAPLMTLDGLNTNVIVAGKMGIGTNAPGYPLHTFQSWVDSGTSYTSVVVEAAGPSASSSLLIEARTNGVSKFSVRKDGLIRGGMALNLSSSLGASASDATVGIFNTPATTLGFASANNEIGRFAAQVSRIGVGSTEANARLQITNHSASINALVVNNSGNPIPALLISSNDNVAIGTTTPTAKLQVIGETATSGLRLGKTNVVYTAGSFTNATLDAVLFHPTGSARTQWLNSAIATNGTMITVKDWQRSATGTNIYITATGGAAVEGAVYPTIGHTLNADGAAATFLYDGTNWFGLSKF